MAKCIWRIVLRVCCVRCALIGCAYRCHAASTTMRSCLMIGPVALPYHNTYALFQGNTATDDNKPSYDAPMVVESFPWFPYSNDAVFNSLKSKTSRPSLHPTTNNNAKMSMTLFTTEIFSLPRNTIFGTSSERWYINRYKLRFRFLDHKQGWVSDHAQPHCPNQNWQVF